MAHSDLHACSRGGGGVRTGAMRLVLLLVLLASPALSRAEALGDVDKDLYDYAASGSLDGCTRSLEAGANPDGYTDADNVGGTCMPRVAGARLRMRGAHGMHSASRALRMCPI